MLIHSTRDAHWLSNSWIVADKVGGDAVLVDSGAPSDEIDAFIAENNLTLRHVLCTHHHYDHVANNSHYRETYQCPVCAHQNEKSLIDGEITSLADRQIIQCGDLEINCLHIPGHTSGQLAFYINEQALFTGDTLFAGSVGGTQAPDHTSFDDIHHSIMNVLFSLPMSTVIYPGHMQASTLATEWDENPFIRAWRGIDHVREQDCLVDNQPAKLLLRAADYDSGTKCWVRSDDSVLNIVAGSKVKTLA